MSQDGDTFSWTQIYPAGAKVTNTFTIAKESDMETIGGKKFKVDGRRRRPPFPPRAPPWLTGVFAGHRLHGRRQAERHLPQLPPHLGDLRGQTGGGKRSEG